MFWGERPRALRPHHLRGGGQRPATTIPLSQPLAPILIGFVTAFADLLIFHDQILEREFMPINTIISWIMFVPGTAAYIRRLHDVNRSGWWVFIALTVVGLIPLFYWTICKGTDGSNKFGDDPLAASEKYVLGEMTHDFSGGTSVQSNFVSCEKSAN